MKTAIVYVVGPRNMFSVDHCEVNEIVARGNHPRATCVAMTIKHMNNDMNAHVCELNYL